MTRSLRKNTFQSFSSFFLRRGSLHAENLEGLSILVWILFQFLFPPKRIVTNPKALSNSGINQFQFLFPPKRIVTKILFLRQSPKSCFSSFFLRRGSLHQKCNEFAEFIKQFQFLFPPKRIVTTTVSGSADRYPRVSFSSFFLRRGSLHGTYYFMTFDVPKFQFLFPPKRIVTPLFEAVLDGFEVSVPFSSEEDRYLPYVRTDKELWVFRHLEFQFLFPPKRIVTKS